MNEKEIFKLLKLLKPYKEKISKVKVRRDRFFPVFVKSSFIKTYEFIFEVFNPKQKLNAFFLIPNLRGICEDLIVLGFLNSIDKTDRENLTKEIFGHTLFKEIAVQKNFFEEIRPFQPIVKSTATKKQLEILEKNAEKILKKYKCKNRKGNTLPNTRELSEKQNLDLLTTVYDYLFRLTSRMVHFNPSTLMTMGWGNKNNRMRFSTENFDKYYHSMASIYGLYLFCLYFELFPRILRASKEIKQYINIFRENLIMIPRWPEMVTFEAMNQPLPKNNLIQIAGQVFYAEQFKKGFLVKKK